MSTSSALGSFPCGKLPPFTGLSGLAQVLRPILNGMFPGPPATKSELVCTVCANWIMVWDSHKSHTDPSSHCPQGDGFPFKVLIVSDDDFVIF